MTQPCPRCGKQDPADIHTCTPLALRLAKEIERWLLVDAPTRVGVAAELRRLHAENEAAHAVGIRQEQELMNCEAQRDDLLAALKRIEMAANATVCNTKWVAEHAKAAIAKVEAGK